jgi:hypothetical protein
MAWSFIDGIKGLQKIIFIRIVVPCRFEGRGRHRSFGRLVFRYLEGEDLGSLEVNRGFGSKVSVVEGAVAESIR